MAFNFIVVDTGLVRVDQSTGESWVLRGSDGASGSIDFTWIKVSEPKSNPIDVPLNVSRIKAVKANGTK